MTDGSRGAATVGTFGIGVSDSTNSNHQRTAPSGLTVMWNNFKSPDHVRTLISLIRPSVLLETFSSMRAIRSCPSSGKMLYMLPFFMSSGSRERTTPILPSTRNSLPVLSMSILNASAIYPRLGRLQSPA